MEMSLLATLSFIIWDVNPDVFTIPYFEHPIRWYGLSWAFGFLFGQQIIYFIYKREGRSAKEVDTLTLYVIVAAILGARLGHVLFYDPLHYLKDPWQILATWEGGLASHGAAIAVLIGLYFFARKTKVKYLWIVDRIAIVATLTGALIRFGNLMNSEMVGLPTSLPWAFIFTSVDNIPRHPAQLYEAIYCFILFLVLFAVWYKYQDKLRNGFLFAWFLIILFSLRFIDEFFKINQVDFENELYLNMGQLLSIPFVIIGVVLLVMIYRKPVKPTNDHGVTIDGQNRLN